MIISHCVIPHGGWRYTQGTTVLFGETFDLLVKTVKSHREANGIPPGDVVDDIEKQIAENQPELKNDNALA